MRENFKNSSVKNKVKQYYIPHLNTQRVATQKEVCINSVSAIYCECDSNSWAVCRRCKFGAIQGRKNESFGTRWANTNGFGKRASKRQTTQNSGWPNLGQGIVGQNTTNNPAQGKHWTLQKFYFSIPKRKQKISLQSLYSHSPSSLCRHLVIFILHYTHPSQQCLALIHP